jgi:hypothetical protein
VAYRGLLAALNMKGSRRQVQGSSTILSVGFWQGIDRNFVGLSLVCQDFPNLNFYMKLKMTSYRI